MPRAVTKKPRVKKGAAVEEPLQEALPIEAPAAVAVAVEEPPPSRPSMVESSGTAPAHYAD